MEDPDRPGDHACPHTLVTSIPDGIHKHEHTHNVNRWIEAKQESRTPAGSKFPNRDTARPDTESAGDHSAQMPGITTCPGRNARPPTDPPSG